MLQSKWKLTTRTIHGMYMKHIKTSCSKSQLRKVELTPHSKNAMTTESILHIAMKPVFVLTKTSLMAVMCLLDHH